MIFWKELQQSADPESGYLSYQYTDQLETSDRVSLGLSANMVSNRHNANAHGSTTDRLVKAVQELCSKHEPSNGLYLFLPVVTGSPEDAAASAVCHAAKEVCTAALQKAFDVVSIESADDGALK